MGGLKKAQKTTPAEEIYLICVSNEKIIRTTAKPRLENEQTVVQRWLSQLLKKLQGFSWRTCTNDHGTTFTCFASANIAGIKMAVFGCSHYLPKVKP